MGCFKSFSAEETIKIGEELGKKLIINDAVLLYGGMGAGKTHFVKGLAQGLGIFTNVTSPTFALVNEYTACNKTNLYHFDLFRINSLDDLYAIGFYDYFGRGNKFPQGIIVCEWSENVPYLETEFENYYKVSIKKINESTREIHVNPRT